MILSDRSLSILRHVGKEGKKEKEKELSRLFRSGKEKKRGLLSKAPLSLLGLRL